MDYTATDSAPTHSAAERREMRVADRQLEVNPLFVQLFPGGGADSAIRTGAQNKAATDGISRIDLPSDWTINQRSTGVGELRVSTPPEAHGETQISVYNRRRPLSELDSEAFNAALNDVNRPSSGALLFDSSWDEFLSIDSTRRDEITRQMQSLSGVLGRTQLGDNQFTNTRKAPDPQAPSFHVDRVQVEFINGRSVLSVDGYMPSQTDGKPERYFTGIFAPNRTSHGTCVNEVFLQAANRRDFIASRAAFLRTLQSIKW